MSEENKQEQRGFIGFDVAELQVIKLAPGDVLSVKLVGDNFDQETMESLQDHLKQVFKDNRIMVFTMPNNSDIVFEAIKPVAPAPSYCDNCNCGKKEGCGP